MRHQIEQTKSSTASGTGKHAPFFGKAAVQPGKAVVQPKLTVNAPGDIYEKEADAVADMVMRMPDIPARPIQRKCAHCEKEEKLQMKREIPGIQRKCKACEEKEKLQRKSLSGSIKPMIQCQAESATGIVSPDVASSLQSSKGNGGPLPHETRNWMESRFGADFSGVKIHTDAHAVQLSRDLNAQAFTHNRDIYFNEGKFDPDSSYGKRLLAHELTHVLQQGAASGLNKIQRQHQCQNDPAAAPAMSCSIATASPVGPNSGISFNIESDSLTTLGDIDRLHDLVRNWHAAGGTDVLRVDGFASCDGPAALNWRLSCDRALTVANELVHPSDPLLQGIDQAFVDIFANGETDRFSSSLAPNRRTVVTIASPTPPLAPPATTTCTPPANPDLSGPAANPTTDGEAAVCVLNPIDCTDAFDCSDVAFAAAGRSGLPGPHLGPQDAFRHCVWNCCMADAMGAAEAERFGTAHENSNPSSILHDNEMDLHNNATGRSLSAPGVNCETECRTAVTSGSLRTIRGPEADRSARRQGLPTPTPPVATTCIGASDQPWP